MNDSIKIKLPEWAIMAIEYGDYSGLDECDTRLLNDWLNVIKANGYRVMISDTDHYFSWNPEFGSACNVVDSCLVEEE